MSTEHTATEAGSLRDISPQDLLHLGTNHIAYVKPAIVEGAPVYAIFDAHGDQIGVAPDRGSALVAVRQHDMEPASVH